jgi:hypothetical protein
MRGRRRLIIAAVALALVSGCGNGTEAVDAEASHSAVAGSVAHALSLWKDFPATSSPRPLVITGPTVNDPATGFPSTAAKIAYISGRISAPTTLPGTTTTWRQHPLITARQAVADLRGDHGAPSIRASLVITSVRLGTAPFSTDRGRRHLPAWMFTFAHVRDPASVLAIAPANRWPASLPASDHTASLSAEITPDGHAVTLTFVGSAAGTGPCTAQYRADTTQSNTAVLISIRALPAS